MKTDIESKYWEDFWCDFCQLDQKAKGVLSQHQICGEPIQKYRAVCPHCGLDMIRLVSHRDEDPYYVKSSKLRQDRNEYAIDILQAEQFGFKTQYPAAHRQFYEKIEIEAELIRAKHKDIGLKGHSEEEKQELKKLQKRPIY